MKTKNAIALILAISTAAIGFLVWLIYFHEAPSSTAHQLSFMPALNALLNTLSATCVAAGIIFIKREMKRAHAAMMIAATITSALFLTSYLIYHAFHGDTKFEAEGLVRGVYFFILVSHIMLSIIALPLILTTIYFAKIKSFTAHRKIACWTYPIWLYVSVTGVLIFIMLELFNAPGA